MVAWPVFALLLGQSHQLRQVDLLNSLHYADVALVKDRHCVHSGK